MGPKNYSVFARKFPARFTRVKITLARGRITRKCGENEKLIVACNEIIVTSAEDSDITPVIYFVLAKL
jgi:hypothetical protein